MGRVREEGVGLDRAVAFLVLGPPSVVLGASRSVLMDHFW